MNTPTPVVRRAIAVILDYIIVFGVLSVVWSLQTFAVSDETGNYGFAGCALLIGSLAFYLSYFALSESVWGQTLGKAAAGVEVQAMNGSKPTFEACLKRHLLDSIEFQLFGLPAFIAAKLTPSGQRLGDLWAKTIVVREKPAS